MSQSIVPNDKFIPVYTKLACVIGIEGAIVLHRILDLLRLDDFGEVRNGKKCIYFSYEQMRSRNFPYMKLRTIRRTVELLEAFSLIDTEERTLGGACVGKWYYENPAGAIFLTEERCANVIERSIAGEPLPQNLGFLKEKRKLLRAGKGCRTPPVQLGQTPVQLGQVDTVPNY
jgi:hypothetical protein